MTKIRSGRSGPARGSDAQVAGRHTAAIQICFRHNFLEKLSPGYKNGLERRPSRFSTICAKNQVLKLNIDKVTVIRVTLIPLHGNPPCSTAIRPYGRTKFSTLSRISRGIQCTLVYLYLFWCTTAVVPYLAAYLRPTALERRSARILVGPDRGRAWVRA